MNQTSSRYLSVALMVVAALLTMAGCKPASIAPNGGDKAPAVKVNPQDAAFEAFSKTAKLPLARVPLVDKAPVIDGTKDDVYDKAKVLDMGFLNGDSEEPQAKTTIRAVCTADKLYLLVVCTLPDMDDLIADLSERDDDVWNDDVVELFLDPTNERTGDYLHLGFNALGTIYDAKGVQDDFDIAWDAKIEIKAKQNEKDWTLEVAIPFKDMVADPAKMNCIWAANINRVAQLADGAEDLAWCPTESDSSHVPSMFGYLWIDAGKVINTPAAKAD